MTRLLFWMLSAQDSFYTRRGVSGLFCFYGPTHSIWKFLGQGLNPSHSCGNTRSFSPLGWGATLHLHSNPSRCCRILSPLCHSRNSHRGRVPAAFSWKELILQPQGATTHVLQDLRASLHPPCSGYPSHSLGRAGFLAVSPARWEGRAVPIFIPPKGLDYGRWLTASC